MEKYLQVSTSSDGNVRLIGIKGIYKLQRHASNTLRITYLDGNQSIDVVFGGDSLAFFSFAENFAAVIEKALATDWTQPVYVTSDSDFDHPISSIS